jgi:hypothetical protein
VPRNFLTKKRRKTRNQSKIALTPALSNRERQMRKGKSKE